MSGALVTGLVVAVAGAAVTAALAPKPNKGGGAAPALAPEVVAPVLAPTVEAPKALPQANDLLAGQARKKSLIEQQSRGGRAATLLSEPSDKLGG